MKDNDVKDLIKSWNLFDKRYLVISDGVIILISAIK